MRLLRQLPTPDTVIFPTHTCFDDASAIFLKMLNTRGFRDGQGPYLVHGILNCEKIGRYSHAWVELDHELHECGLLDGEKVVVVMHRDEYLAHRRCEDFTRYDPFQAYTTAKANGGLCGPWKKEYIELTGTDRKTNYECTAAAK